MDLQKYISKAKQSSLLLMGKEGLSLKEDALALAKVLLDTENLSVHPDYLYVSSDKKTLGVDDIVPIIEKGAHPPCVASMTVVVIEEMDKLTVVAQNKLLLLLESNPYVFVIGCCYQDTILQTIKSRMRIISYLPLTKKEFEEQSNLPMEDAEIYYYATGGSLGLLEKVMAHNDIFQGLSARAVLYTTTQERSNILDILHLVKEKDKAAVTNDPVLMKAIVRLMAHHFMKSALEAQKKGSSSVNALLEIVDALVEEEVKISSVGYSKDDFFKTMVFCIEH